MSSFAAISAVIRDKDKMLRRRHRWVDFPTGFNPPTCKECGQPARMLMEADGACGDPACCPQSEHVEVVCVNLACPIWFENAR